MGEEASPSAQTKVSASSSDTKSLPYTELNHIVELFGVKNHSTSKQKTENTVPESKLTIKLVGTIVGIESADYAFIYNGNSQKLFKIGEDIYSQKTELKAVYPDHIIIDNEGKIERITLHENIPDQPRPNSTKHKTPKHIEKDINGFIKKIQYKTHKPHPKIAINIIQTISSETPTYRLYPGRDKGFFKRLGLVRGDILLKINDIDSSETNPNISLRKEVIKTLTIRRGGETLKIEI